MRDKALEQISHVVINVVVFLFLLLLSRRILLADSTFGRMPWSAAVGVYHTRAHDVTA